MTLFEARSEALKLLAKQGYQFNWPGRLVAMTNPACDGDAICFAIPMDDTWSSSARFIRELDNNWAQPSYWKVLLEARYVAWRWWNRWRWRTDRMFVYSLTDEDHDAFMSFCRSGETS